MLIKIKELFFLINNVKRLGKKKNKKKNRKNEIFVMQLIYKLKRYFIFANLKYKHRICHEYFQDKNIRI